MRHLSQEVGMSHLSTCTRNGSSFALFRDATGRDIALLAEAARIGD
jgi:hypothetical protein